MPEPDKPDIELLKLQLEVWKQSIASTMHFTEMSVKTRQLGLTFVVGSFALAITVLSQFRDARVSIPVGKWDYDLHISGIIIIASTVGLFVTKILDVKLYHRMLRGSVAFSDEYEKRVLQPNVMPKDLGLTALISKFSRSKRQENPALDPGGKSQKTAEKKISAFYNLSMLFVFTVGALLTWITAIPVEKKIIINQRIQFEQSTPASEKPR